MTWKTPNIPALLPTLPPDVAAKLAAIISTETDERAAELAKRDLLLKLDPSMVKRFAEQFAKDARTMEMIDQAITNRHKPKKD